MENEVLGYNVLNKVFVWLNGFYNGCWCIKFGDEGICIECLIKRVIIIKF